MSGNVTSDLADQLSAYLDGTLSDAERAKIEALVASDADAADELAALQQADAAIGSAFASMLETPVPRALISAIEETPVIPSAANLPRPPRWGFGTVAAALALLMIGAGGGSVLTRLYTPSVEIAAAPGWLDQVAEYHRVYAREGRHLVEVPAADAAHLQTWLSNRTGVAFSIPDLTGRGLTFAGGRLLVAAGKPVGQLMYTDADGQVVALCFIANDGMAPMGGQPDFTNRSFADVDMVVWMDRNASYVAIGPAIGIDLDQIARDAAVAL
ncbi:zf-HC2 domain-containing protein [Aliiroseovarius sp. YM-037]|uniref:zf-HC2 domain-containing protein n=1 Tax=Aliiroseovarius sp. YM-037 TaxID=3341728 RepID=UPI003A7F69FE